MGLIGTETELGVKVRWAGPGVVPGGILLLGNSGIPLLGDDRGSRRAYGRSGRGIRNKPPRKASLWRGRLKASTKDEGAPSPIIPLPGIPPFDPTPSLLPQPSVVVLYRRLVLPV
jgi:hypothetical protein